MITYSVIKKSQLEGAHRLDAEYYQPEYLSAERKFSQFRKMFFLKDIASITTGPAYSSDEMRDDSDIPLARIGDVTNKTEVESWIKLSSKEFQKFNNKKIHNLDILMTMTGDPPDVGKCNLVRIDNKTLAFNQRVAKISAKKNPYYLFAYLSTELVRLQTERTALGIRQRNVGINDLRSIKVATPSDDRISIIEESIIGYLDELENSKSLYSQAENLLLEELDLKNFASESDLWSVVKLSEARKANRIDAEYFDAKYQKLFTQIQKHNGRTLGELATLKKGFEPGSEAYQDEGKLFIRVSSISKDGITDKDQKYLRNDLYEQLKKDYEPKVGEILLTKDASPGVAYVVKKPIEGLTSGGVLRVRIKENVEPEYLALVINSFVGQLQVDRDAGGSVIAHWKPDQVREFQVPILPNKTQEKIAELVQKSHAARKQAKELLEQAKRKVEEMIENQDKRVGA